MSNIDTSGEDIGTLTGVCFNPHGTSWNPEFFAAALFAMGVADYAQLRAIAFRIQRAHPDIRACYDAGYMSLTEITPSP